MRRHTGMLALVLAIFCTNALGVEHTKDTLEQVRKNVSAKKAVLIDVREKDEWDDGHLKDATLVELSKLSDVANRDAGPDELAKSLPKDKIIYCH